MSPSTGLAVRSATHGIMEHVSALHLILSLRSFIVLFVFNYCQISYILIHYWSLSYIVYILIYTVIHSYYTL